jgi:hypothetical protein
MNRARWSAVVYISLLAGGIAAFWMLLYRPISEHGEWSRRMRANIEMLAHKRPADVPPGQWEFMVGWTINMHCNSAGGYSWVDRDKMAPFLVEFERRLQGPVGVETIDWLWDEYVRITEGGHRYDEKNRPTRSPELLTAEPGCFGIGIK